MFVYFSVYPLDYSKRYERLGFIAVVQSGTLDVGAENAGLENNGLEFTELEI